jgi:hypothetical protein
MPPLNLEPNISAPDDFYQRLLDAHRDLSPAQSELLNAKLILLLANQVGDAVVLGEALDTARAGVTEERP